jgi:hypothetical protein
MHHTLPIERAISTASSMFLPALLVLLPLPAHAYVGPGAGLTAIGTIVAVLAAVLLALVGFVWYPVKRLLRRKPSVQAAPMAEATAAATGPAVDDSP